jgi:hypothetical protein
MRVPGGFEDIHNKVVHLYNSTYCFLCCRIVLARGELRQGGTWGRGRAERGNLLRRVIGDCRNPDKMSPPQITPGGE